MSRLGTRLIALHRSLNGVPHAFGGAIALAYCVREPRATRDLDVNVFVPTAFAGGILRALPAAVRVEDADVATALRDGQVRVWWDETPLDLFFNEHEFHVWVSTTVREVPFESETIPVIGCTALAVFKALFDRTKDWADIEAMIEAGFERGQALTWLARLLPAGHPAPARLAAL